MRSVEAFDVVMLSDDMLMISPEWTLDLRDGITRVRRFAIEGMVAIEIRTESRTKFQVRLRQSSDKSHFRAFHKLSTDDKRD